MEYFLYCSILQLAVRNKKVEISGFDHGSCPSQYGIIWKLISNMIQVPLLVGQSHQFFIHFYVLLSRKQAVLAQVP